MVLHVRFYGSSDDRSFWLNGLSCQLPVFKQPLPRDAPPGMRTVGQPPQLQRQGTAVADVAPAPGPPPGPGRGGGSNSINIIYCKSFLLCLMFPWFHLILPSPVPAAGHCRKFTFSEQGRHSQRKTLPWQRAASPPEAMAICASTTQHARRPSLDGEPLPPPEGVSDCLVVER